MMPRDWSALPAEAISFISSCLSNDADYLRFRSVCTSWLSAAPRRPLRPCLIIKINQSAYSLCNFPDAADHFTPRLPHDMARDRFICGSSGAWVFLLHRHAPGISLHNPFNAAHLSLPPITRFIDNQVYRSVSDNPDFFFNRMFGVSQCILSADPLVSLDDCMVMAVCYHREGQKIIHCRPGDVSWTRLSHPFTDPFFFKNAAFFKGKFYALSGYRVFVCDMGVVTEVLPADQLFSDGVVRDSGPTYLVESSGDLLLASVELGNGGGRCCCEVFQVVFQGGLLRLVKVESLGGRSLFLGPESMPVSAGNLAWCKGNCVYHIGVTSGTSDNLDAARIKHDGVTVFSMEDGSTSFIPSVSDGGWAAHWLIPTLDYSKSASFPNYAPQIKKPDWSTLQPDAISYISNRISNDADYLRFQVVCTSWFSAALKRQQRPWLLVQYPIGSVNNDSAFGLCNFPDTELRVPLLPEDIARDKFICNSSLGWVFLLDRDVPGISLHNPFTGAHLRLPPITDFLNHETYRRISDDSQFSFNRMFGVTHSVLSSDPVRAPHDCVVMAVCHHREGQRLIQCRPGDLSWTRLSLPFTAQRFFKDVAFYKGQFYLVSGFRLFVCDIVPNALVTEILPGKPLFSDCRNRDNGLTYLVESSGDLLLATVKKSKGHQCFCEVFRVEFEGGLLRLVKLKNLGGRSLFLCPESTSVSAGNSTRYKGNCIYHNILTFGKGGILDVMRKKHIGVTVFSMEDNSSSFIASVSGDCWAAHWLTPSLH